MKVCRFCHTKNVDWLQIRLECGNPIVSSTEEKEKIKMMKAVIIRVF